MVECIRIFNTDGAMSLAPLAGVPWIGSFDFDGPVPLPVLHAGLELIERLRIAQTASRDLTAFDSVVIAERLMLGGNSQLESLDGLHHDGSFDGDLYLHQSLDVDLAALSQLSAVSTL